MESVKKYLVVGEFLEGGDFRETFDSLEQAESYAFTIADQMAQYWEEHLEHCEHDLEEGCISKDETEDERIKEFCDKYCGEDFFTVRKAIRSELIKISEFIED